MQTQFIPEISSDNIWEKPDIVYPLVFYEQLELPFLTNLTECVVLNVKNNIGQLTKSNFY